jgi:hypothetical protein
MWFISHFDLIPHQWQMMTSGSNRNKQQQSSGGPTAKLRIQDIDYDQYRPATPLQNKLVPIHVLFQSL